MTSLGAHRGLPVARHTEHEGLGGHAAWGHGIRDRATLSSLAQARHLDESLDWLSNDRFDMVLPIHYHLIDG